jgi:hypothetical protein
LLRTGQVRDTQGFSCYFSSCNKKGVAPCAGRGSKRAAVLRRPCAGAWIETRSGYRRPLRGAWIETAIACAGSSVNRRPCAGRGSKPHFAAARRPCAGRGSKHRGSLPRRPCAGAWIETRPAVVAPARGVDRNKKGRGSMSSSTSPPARGRGSKQHQCDGGSPPARGRGSKPCRHGRAVAPCAGAWIETRCPWRRSAAGRSPPARGRGSKRRTA